MFEIVDCFLSLGNTQTFILQPLALTFGQLKLNRTTIVNKDLLRVLEITNIIDHFNDASEYLNRCLTLIRKDLSIVGCGVEEDFDQMFKIVDEHDKDSNSIEISIKQPGSLGQVLQANAMKYKKLPDILIFNLDRTDYTFEKDEKGKRNFKSIKLQYKFEFAPEIDMEPYLTIESSSPYVYKLHSVVAHRGSPLTGHYITFSDRNVVGEFPGNFFANNFKTEFRLSNFVIY